MRQHLHEMWRSVGHLGKAVAFGLLLTFACLILYAALVRWWLVYPLDDPASRMATEFSFAQVYTGFWAVLLAGTLGFYAIREFSQQQERPALRLRMHPIFKEKGTEHLRLSPEPGYQASHYWFSIAIHNEGPIAAVWYMVEFSAPFLQPLKPSPGEIWTTVKPFVGQPEAHWQQTLDADGVFSFKFSSQGQFAVYPGTPLTICEVFLMTSEIPGPVRFDSRYRVATDRSQPYQGTITLELTE